MIAALTAYPSWLNAGDNTWQLTAATFVGLMSLPGLAVLYGGLVPKKWAVNTMLMAFSGFSLVLIVWLLAGFSMGFGAPVGGGFAAGHTAGISGFLHNFVGKPHSMFNAIDSQAQANLPESSGTTAIVGSGSAAAVSGTSVLGFHFPEASLFYFQFVFAAITPLLFLGSVLGRMKFKAWLVFVPLWSLLVYSINAFLLWGGGWLATKGAVDFSGGYVIHMSAGVSGFVAAWILGPRLARDRKHFVPNNLLLCAVGAGILWLGWNGFNGGDPYFAGASASSAVLNTNVCTAAALLTWVVMDMTLLKQRKPTLLGAINGMIVGLVAITPSAGWVDGFGALAIGILASILIWFAWNYLPKIRPFSKVDDALGVVFTHGMAGLIGGLFVGIFADGSMIEYVGTGKTGSLSITGLLYGSHSLTQLWHQFYAACWVIFWSALVTFILMHLIKLVIGLREPDEVLEIGDLAIHDEEVYPTETFAERVLAGATAARAEGSG